MPRSSSSTTSADPAHARADARGRGLRRRARGDGGEALGVGRALGARPARPRRDDAGHGRPRGLPPDPREGARAPDPAAHRPRRRRRPRRRARGGRRRLPRQAVRDRELLARVRALLRRGERAGECSRRGHRARRRPARQCARRSRGRAHAARGRPARALAAATRGASSRATRRSSTSGATAARPRTSVDRYVAYLRRKLGEPPLIQTVRGVGFALEAMRHPLACACASCSRRRGGRSSRVVVLGIGGRRPRRAARERGRCDATLRSGATRSRS